MCLGSEGEDHMLEALQLDPYRDFSKTLWPEIISVEYTHLPTVDGAGIAVLSLHRPRFSTVQMRR